MTDKKKGAMGKAEEAIVAKWLGTRSARDVGFWWHRFPDARAARGALAAQPSDFIVVTGARCVFLEVKATSISTRLPKDKVGQYGTLMSAWWAGATIYVLVHRTVEDDWLILTSAQLFTPGDLIPTSFSFTGLHSFETAEAALSSIFPKK